MNIHVNSPIGGTGYGVASLNIVKALAAEGNDVALTLIGLVAMVQRRSRESTEITQ